LSQVTLRGVDCCCQSLPRISDREPSHRQFHWVTWPCHRCCLACTATGAAPLAADQETHPARAGADPPSHGTDPPPRRAPPCGAPRLSLPRRPQRASAPSRGACRRCSQRALRQRRSRARVPCPVEERQPDGGACEQSGSGSDGGGGTAIAPPSLPVADPTAAMYETVFAAAGVSPMAVRFSPLPPPPPTRDLAHPRIHGRHARSRRLGLFPAQADIVSLWSLCGAGGCCCGGGGRGATRGAVPLSGGV